MADLAILLTHAIDVDRPLPAGGEAASLHG